MPKKKNIYEMFKKELLNELVKKRDLIVLRYPKPDIENIFSISSFNEKIYNRIITSFDYVAIRNVEKLLGGLCVKNNVEYTMNKSIGFDLTINIKNKMCFIEIKTNIDNECIDKISLISNKKPLYIIYLIKNNRHSKELIKKLNNHCEERKYDNIKIISFEDFLLKVYGRDELIEFKKSMISYKEEMHKAVGYQIMEIFNDYNLRKLKSNIRKEFSSIDFNDYFSDVASIDTLDIENIKNNFLNKKRYNILLKDNDFAKSFLTSEWLYKKYFLLEEMDNTFIVSGYLKSIEQLLWEIIQIVGSGRNIKRRNGTRNKYYTKIDDSNIDRINKELGSLQDFINNSDNTDLFDDLFGRKKEIIQHFLYSQIKDWKNEYRNGYFHKDVLTNQDKILKIRKETIFLLFLIIGSLKIDDIF